MNKKGNRYFLILFLVIGLAPVLQQVFHPFRLQGLSGAFTIQASPVFTASSFLEGAYQKEADDYLKDNTAFRGDLVRLRNQVAYYLFGNINTVFMLGKEQYIFDPNYIDAITGKDAVGDTVRQTETASLARALQILDSIHVPLIFCFPPSKAVFYSEYLPTAVVRSPRCNQDFFRKLLLSNQVNLIDFDSWFLRMKGKTPYLLVPKYGAHWTMYGATLAADSLLCAIEKVKAEKYARFSVKNYELSEKAKYTDDDYLPSLNLIWKWKSPAMAYPELQFESGKKPNVLIISDSYFWNFYDLGIVEHCMSPLSEMWYYNRLAYDQRKEEKGKRNGTVSLNEIRNRDAIVIISAEPNLREFGFGFFDQLARMNK